MKKILLLISLLLATNAWAYSETDLAKFKALNACEGCDLSGADLTGLKGPWRRDFLTGANLSGANLSGVNLSGVNLSGVNLTDADLTDADLTQTDLTDADLTGAVLTGADLKIASLRGANLVGATLIGVNLTGTVLTDANLTGADLTKANTGSPNTYVTVLKGANLNGVNLTDANLRSVQLNGIRGAYVASADLAANAGATLIGATLIGVNLRHVNLTGVNLTDADLTGADLCGAKVSVYVGEYTANLNGANLNGVNLTDADLEGTNLEGANLTDADLSRADLTKANLSGVDLTTSNLRNAQLGRAKYCKTKMPWGELNDDCSEFNQTQSTEKEAEDNSSNIEQDLEILEQLFKNSVISEDKRNTICHYPEKINLPDGNSATKKEMATTRYALKAWSQAIEDFQICIEQEEQSTLALLKINGELTPDVKTKVQDLINRIYDASDEDMAKTAYEWNTQNRKFKALNLSLKGRVAPTCNDKDVGL